MSTLLCIIIGVIAQKTLESCDITLDMWQSWVILACIISSLSVGCFLI